MLRHDFRTIYHCSYDEVPIDEAIDLIRTLPDGCMYVSATNPARSWTKERQMLADLQDDLYAMFALSNGAPRDRIPHVIRPAERLNNARAHNKAKQTRKRIEEMNWEEV